MHCAHGRTHPGAGRGRQVGSISGQLHALQLGSGATDAAAAVHCVAWRAAPALASSEGALCLGGPTGRMVLLLLPALLLATRHALSAHPLRGNVLPSGGTEFLGIRFAAMPERFEPSGPPLPWPSDPTAVTSFGPDCTQPTDMLRHATSEDCLYLNVYRPPVPSSASSVPSGGDQLLPVMVFVHGGGMVRGAGSWYNGSALAETQNVLLVTFNYRLGPLGFASANASGPHGTGSMNGVHDQITALQYVQANIHRFGGDPSRVTLFGQSAGGLSVCSLLFSPLARGLFSRAAIQSGSCTGPWGPGSNADGLAATARFLDAVAVGRSGASLTDLRDRQRFPATKLPSWSHGDLNSLEFPGYFVDGWVLMDSPASLSQHPASSEDRAYTVPYDELDALLIGSNSRDGMMACCEDSSSLPATLSAYGPALLKHWTVGVVSTLPAAINSTTLANGIAQQYQPADYGGTAAAAFVAADSDYNLYCPELQMLTLKRRRQWARPLIQQNVDGDRPRSYAYFWHYVRQPVFALNLRSSQVAVCKAYASHVIAPW